ncbi:MAG: type VII secretion target [Mycobacteriales bacterium]
MVESLVVTPSDLLAGAARIRSSTRQVAGARASLVDALEDVVAQRPGTLTAAAAVELSAVAAACIASLAAGVETLASALTAAAARYSTTDAMLASIAARR